MRAGVSVLGSARNFPSLPFCCFIGNGGGKKREKGGGGNPLYATLGGTPLQKTGEEGRKGKRRCLRGPGGHLLYLLLLPNRLLRSKEGEGRGKKRGGEECAAGLPGIRFRNPPACLSIFGRFGWSEIDTKGREKKKKKGGRGKRRPLVRVNRRFFLGELGERKGGKTCAVCADSELPSRVDAQWGRGGKKKEKEKKEEGCGGSGRERRTRCRWFDCTLL